MQLGILQNTGFCMAFHSVFGIATKCHEGHQKTHAAEAAQNQVVSEAPFDDRESITTEPAPTLRKMNNTAQVVPTRASAGGKGTPSSSTKQAKEKGKELDNV